MFLTDLRWLQPADIASYQFFGERIDGLVPFAVSARRDEWCWRLDRQTGDEPAVVFCGRGDVGVGYASDFRSFLFRILLEEFSGTWLVDSFGADGAMTQLQSYVAWLSPYFPENWSQQLRELASGNIGLLADGSHGVFSRQECNAIVKNELAFAHLNEEFMHERESERGKR